MGQASAAITLYHSLIALLKLFAPFLPYVTEEIWLDMLGNQSSIHTKNTWPVKINFAFADYSNVDLLIFDIINTVRRTKTEKSLSIKAPISLIQVYNAGFNVPQDLIEDLKNVTCVDKFELLNSLEYNNCTTKVVV